jgi:hypothetical protein
MQTHTQKHTHTPKHTKDLGDVAFEELVVILTILGRALQGIGHPQGHGRLLCICRFISDADDQQAHESEGTRCINAASSRR